MGDVGGEAYYGAELGVGLPFWMLSKVYRTGRVKSYQKQR